MARLWSQYKDPMSAASMPIVDFSKYVVLGLFRGRGDGCSQIRADTVEGTRIAGEYFVTEDETPKSGPCPAVLIDSGQFIAIPR